MDTLLSEPCERSACSERDVCKQTRMPGQAPFIVVQAALATRATLKWVLRPRRRSPSSRHATHELVEGRTNLFYLPRENPSVLFWLREENIE